VDGVQVFDSRDTHHGISFKECKVCHDKIDLPEDEKTEEGSTDIRICERCHNVKALHEVVPHVEKNACSVCHGGKTVTAQPAGEGTTQPEGGETE